MIDWFKPVALAALLAGMLALAGCTDETPVYRYRMTVEVETPEGLKTGSSVIEVETAVAGEYSIPTPGYVSNRVRGEAAAVDLGNGKVLFALLRSPNDVDWAGRVMFLLAPRSSDFQATFDAMLRDRREITLPRIWPPAGHLGRRSAYPMLVTFEDITDPASVALVDPDDLGATFGEGVRLKRITVQMTDDPVAIGIEERLGWMDLYRNRHFDGTSTVSEDLTAEDLRAHLTAGSFSTEFAR